MKKYTKVVPVFRTVCYALLVIAGGQFSLTFILLCFTPLFQASQVWTAWFLIQQYKSSRKLVTEIWNDLPRIVEIQFCLTKFLCKSVYWIGRLVLCLLKSCLTRRSTLCCESIRSIFYCDYFVLLTVNVGFPLNRYSWVQNLPILKFSISSPHPV